MNIYHLLKFCRLFKGYLIIGDKQKLICIYLKVDSDLYSLATIGLIRCRLFNNRLCTIYVFFENNEFVNMYETKDIGYNSSLKY